MDNDDKIITKEDLEKSENQADTDVNEKQENEDNTSTSEEIKAKEDEVDSTNIGSYSVKHSRTSRKKKEKKRNFKKFLLMFIIVFSVVSLAGLGLAYKLDSNINAVNADNKTNQEFEKMLNSKDSQKQVVGQKEDAKKVYGVDATKVWNSLNTYDFDNNGKKEVFLTFDDGPSTTNTPKILKILDDNNVKATFFVTGKAQSIDGAPEILKKAYEDGMAIGNHSFSHDYSYLYPKRVYNEKNFLSDIEKNEKKIQESLGMPNFTTRVVRCPGGQMSWQKTAPLNEYFITHDMASIDWNSLNGDAEPPKKDAAALYNFAVKESHGKNLVVLLMHDTYGKEETVKYLDKMIKYYKSQGYEFKTLV